MSTLDLRLHNTAARGVEPVVLAADETVGIYTCGPTVYRPVHLGNLRSYLLADWLKRLLLHAGSSVKHVKNITDVGHMRQELLDRGEDKVIAEAISAGLTPDDIAQRYTQEFFRDEACIKILPADVFPRATDHVGRMIEISAALVANGSAYEREGNVYFRVSSFNGYGELGGAVSREGLRQGVRAEADRLKEDARDFALWKAAEAGRTELVWDSPWGRGFPGWHIECTRHEHAASRTTGRHPHGWCRQHFPAPRRRKGAERGVHRRRPVRARLGARPALAGGRPENGQVHWQCVYIGRSARAEFRTARLPVFVFDGALSGQAEFHVHQLASRANWAAPAASACSAVGIASCRHLGQALRGSGSVSEDVPETGSPRSCAASMPGARVVDGARTIGRSAGCREGGPRTRV